MKLTITIKMDGAAFKDGAGFEAARILRDLADGMGPDLQPGSTIQNIRDSNGNVVGEAVVK